MMNTGGSNFELNAIQPPKTFHEEFSIQTSRSDSFRRANTSAASAKRKITKLRNYFDDSDDDDDQQLLVTSPAKLIEDDDYDPLDAFMAGVQEQVQKEESSIGLYNPPPEIVSGQDDRDYSSYLEDVDESTATVDGADVPYDSDGFPISDSVKKDGEKSRIEPLPALDHTQVSYRPFRKNFYKESVELSSLTETDVSILLEELEVNVQGSDVPKPLKSFSVSCIPLVLQKEISKVGFEKPTSIQAQALPIALAGRDLIGLAKTGSGKTLAYLWPMIVHVLDQPQMQIGDGPIGVVLSPTRELAAQIYSEAKKFAKVFSIRVCAVFGGGGKWEMVKALKEAPEIVVATPATMKRKIEGFARELLTNPIRIVVGTIGQANPDIRQIVELVENDQAKWTWLAERADEYVADGKVLIFVLSKTGVEEVTAALRRHFTARQLNVGVESLHGDKDQAERTISMRKFSKTEETAILVATDIAARGLDVKDIRTVINYDVAKNIETYVHRIGRTGRMGLDGVVPGTAYTLITPADGSFAVDLVQNLNLSSQKVPTALQALAEKDPKWSRIRHISAGGGRGAAPSSHFTAGRGGGIGFSSGGRPAAKSMTSSMLAATSSVKSSGSGCKNGIQMTFMKAMGGTIKSNTSDSDTVTPFIAHGGAIPGSTAANPYIEGQGMGRGKHLTKPSWSNVNGKDPEIAISTSIGQFDDAVRTVIPENAPIIIIEKKRSRFSGPSSSTAPEPTIPGFVRSTSNVTVAAVLKGNMLSAYNTAVAGPVLVSDSKIPLIPTKKSRWDS